MIIASTITTITMTIIFLVAVIPTTMTTITTTSIVISEGHKDFGGFRFKCLSSRAS